MSLKRETILSANDISTEEVQVPEWGGSVLVRGMSGAERDQYEFSMISGKGTNMEMNLQDVRTKLVVICTVDETGARLFNDTDIVALSRKSASALDRVFAVAQRLSGIGKADIDMLSKNSAGVPSADSRTN
jgi:hypothetical protein